MPTRDRIVNIDGISYSLDSGKAVGEAHPAKTSPRPRPPVKPDSAQPIKAAAISKFATASSSPTQTSRRSSQRLDGLSRNKPHTVPAHKKLPTKPAAELVQSKTPTPPIAPAKKPRQQPKISSEELVSHPSLPIKHQSEHATTSQHGSLALVFLKPLTAVFNKPVWQLATLSSFSSLTLILLIILPVLPRSLPALADSIANWSSVIGHVDFLIWGLVVIFGSAVIIIVSTLATQSIFAVTLKWLDHRSYSLQTLWRQATASIIRLVINGFLNTVWLLMVILITTQALRLLVIAQASFIVLTRPIIVSLVLTLASLAVIWIYFASIYQQAIVAVSDQKAATAGVNSYKLTIRHYLKLIPFGLFWLVLDCGFLLIIGLVVGVELHYLSATTTSLWRWFIWLAGFLIGGLVIVIWKGYRAGYWASVYHRLLVRTPRLRAAEYLTTDKPVGSVTAKVIGVVVVIIIIAAGYASLTIYYQPQIEQKLDDLSRLRINTTKLIPKPNSQAPH